ncbi:HNH endonuclease signature motif containing protein [Ramlibacter sp.]|uniref:HNH endonuclease signature motif containing protein n=1 Tax=Ramlibacter sp. TaxID=1917967 RepID=UPI00262BFD27|nr:HNH endonuclease signature motif containing protein [Ramlibacter sp.]
MTPTEDDRFTQFLYDKAHEAQASIGYTPNIFLQMLGSQGGYQTAVQLLSGLKISDGFTKLWQGKRLDLTVEALVLESQWRNHFDARLLEVAQKRLRDVGYHVRAVSSATSDGPKGRGRKRHSAAAGTTDLAARTTLPLVLRWSTWIEYMTLELDSLETGAELESVETWLDGSEPTTYSIRCGKLARDSNQRWSIPLVYDERHGKNPAIAAKYGDSVDWGTLIISISADLTTVTGTFEPVDGSAGESPKITIAPAGLYSGLSRAQIEVLLRPDQGRLRKRLLALYGACAVSNESTEQALEAAHIIDHAASGASSERNAILLRADLHTLFDRGMLRISGSGKVDLSGVPNDSPYHTERKNWNKVLPSKVLTAVRDALKAASDTSE